MFSMLSMFICLISSNTNHTTSSRESFDHLSTSLLPKRTLWHRILHSFFSRFMIVTSGGDWIGVSPAFMKVRWIRGGLAEFVFSKWFFTSSEKWVLALSKISNISNVGILHSNVIQINHKSSIFWKKIQSKKYFIKITPLFHRFSSEYACVHLISFCKLNH